MDLYSASEEFGWKFYTRGIATQMLLTTENRLDAQVLKRIEANFSEDPDAPLESIFRTRVLEQDHKPVHTHGKYDPEGILEHVHNTIEVEVDVTAIPASLDLDIEGLMAGDSKTASEVTLPEGVILKSDPKMTVIHLS